MARLTGKETPYRVERNYLNDKYGNKDGGSLCNWGVHITDKQQSHLTVLYILLGAAVVLLGVGLTFLIIHSI